MSNDINRMKKLLGLSTTLPQGTGGGLFSGLMKSSQPHTHGAGCGCGHSPADDEDGDQDHSQ